MKSPWLRYVVLYGLILIAGFTARSSNGAVSLGQPGGNSTIPAIWYDVHASVEYHRLPAYFEGFNDGEMLGFNTGYARGAIRGEGEGKAEGARVGYQTGWNVSYPRAYDRAYESSYPSGIVSGWGFGFTNSFVNGFNSANSYLSQHLDGSGIGSSTLSVSNHIGTIGSVLTLSTGGIGSGHVQVVPSVRIVRQGYDDGYRAGFDSGVGNGDEAGFEISYPLAYLRAFGPAQAQGHEAGITAGSIDGESSGYRDGYVKGTDDGVLAGFQEGYVYRLRGGGGTVDELRSLAASLAPESLRLSGLVSTEDSSLFRIPQAAKFNTVSDEQGSVTIVPEPAGAGVLLVLFVAFFRVRRVTKM